MRPSMSLSSRKKRMKRVLAKLRELFPVSQSALTFTHDYEFLFAVMLSAQTTDKQVNTVTDRLFKKYPTLADYLLADRREFERDIASIGLYRSKAKNILSTARLLVSKYGGEVPNQLAKLVEFPGVGRKTANVVQGRLFGIAEGIAVDTHVARLSRKYFLTRFVGADTIERDLMEITPQSQWIEFTNRMIEYGRRYCPARCKNCPLCPLWDCV